MKKLMLMFAMLVMAISSSFAYNMQGMQVSYNSTESMQVHINGYANTVSFECYFGSLPSSGALGGAVAYGDILVGEYNYMQGVNSPGYMSEIEEYRYWGTVTAYMSTNNCTGGVIIRWS